MTYTGKVEKGVVIFESDIKPADGVLVRVEEVLPSDPLPAERSGSIWDDLKEISGIGQELDDLAGTADGLPADLAEKHDEYRRKQMGL